MGKNPEIFFPVRGDTASGSEAQKVCFSCPVRTECKEWFKKSGSTDGIWGAEYHSEKKDLQRRKEEGA